jgi:hypothetical protein
MSYNCLVTKLKGVVDNPNLEYLDYVKVAGTLTTGYSNAAPAITLNSGEGTKVKVFSGDVTLTSGGANVVINGTAGTSFVLLIPRYTTTSIIFLDVRITWDFDTIKSIFGVESLMKGGNSACKFNNFTVDKLKEMKSLNSLSISEGGITADIARFAEMPALTYLRLNYCAQVTGDLAGIKDMPNLQTLILNPTVVTDNDNTVAYLENRGVAVTYSTYTPT